MKPAMPMRACTNPWEVSFTTLFLGGLLASGCAEPPFSLHAQDNELKTLRPTLARLAAPRQAPPSAHMAYVFAGPERRGDKDLGPAEKSLYGYDLQSGKVVFSVPADVRSRFVVSGSVLAYREGERDLVLRDAQTGQERGRVAIPDGETLAGLTGDGGQVYFVTRAAAEKGKAGSRSFVTALDAQGQKKWRLPAPGTAGAPAATGGLVAVPFRYQELVVLDGASGQELTRIRQRDEQIGFVRSGNGGFLYGIGEKGVALLSESSVRGEKNKIAYAEPALGERVRTFLHFDGYRPEQLQFSAFDRNRLLWDVEPQGETVRFQDGQAILHAYRFVFDVETVGGKVRWAYAHPRHNIMSSDLTGDAVWFIAQDGELGMLDRKTGARTLAERIELKPGQQVLGAAFDVAAGLPGRGTPQATKPVLDVLHSIIFEKDSSFLSVKTFAVQSLGNLSGKEATAELLQVVTAEGLPPQLGKTAGEVLTARKDPEGTEFLIAALKQSYDFLEDRRPRGIEILAKVAAAMAAKEATPVLAERLLDPSTPTAALKEVVSALTTLGGEGSARALRDLLMMYRSDAAFQSDVEALRRAGDGLLKLDGDAGRRTVLFVALEPHTLPPLAGYFKKALDDTAPGRKKVDPKKTSTR